MYLKTTATIIAGLMTASFLAACTESPEQQAARLKQEEHERAVMVAAKDRIDRVQNRFVWDVNKRSCYLTDRTDGTKYTVYSDGTAKTAGGPAEFLTHGSVDRSKRRCYVTDFKENVHCASNRSDQPVCKPAELYSPKEQAKLGFKG